VLPDDQSVLWKANDPRGECKGGAHIVVLRPSPTVKNEWEAGTGNLSRDARRLFVWFGLGMHYFFDGDLWLTEWRWMLMPPFPEKKEENI
jgi:hypothetical protein